MDLIQKLKDQVKPLGKKIVLPEYKDERVLKATEIILKEGFVTPVLVGNPAEIAAAAKAVGVSVEGAEIIDPANYDRYQEMVDTFVDISRILNRESGLLGVSESSSDMRDIHTAMHNGDEKAKLAYDIFVDRLQKYIGQYLAVLNGADAIIFTAGIGENAVNVRSSIINGISWFGCKVDPEKNVFGVVGDISTDDSRIKVLVIPTDEELVIARDVERFKNQ